MYKTCCTLILLAFLTDAAAQSEQRQFWALNGSYSGFTWDNTSGDNRVDNGSGTWDNVSQKWTVNNGVADQIWKTGVTAIFGGNPGTGAAGTVTVSGTQTAHSLQFNPPASGNFLLTGGTITNTSGLITANASATIASTLGGAAGLTLAGTGTLNVSTTPTYTGTTTVQSGTLLFSNGIANSYAVSLATPVTIAAGATLAGDITGNINLSGAISGPGTLATTGAGAQTMRLYGNNSGFTGNFSEPSGTRGLMWSDDQGFGNAALTGSAAASWDLSGSFGVIETTGATTPVVQLGSLSGSVAGTNLGGFGGTGIMTFQIGALNTSTTYAGSIVDNPLGSGTPVIALTKVGSGTLTIGGSSTYSGSTSVNAGSLVLSSPLTASTTWNMTVNATAAPSSANSGSMTLPNTPSMTGVTVNIVLTGASTGFTWNAVTWTGTATGTPILKINGVTVTSGVPSGGTTVTFTANSHIKVVR